MCGCVVASRFKTEPARLTPLGGNGRYAAQANDDTVGLVGCWLVAAGAVHDASFLASVAHLSRVVVWLRLQALV